MDKTLINSRFNLAILYILDNKLAATKAEIASKLNIPASRFAEIRGERMNVSAEIVARLAQNYPQISVEWLLMGVGSMTLDGKNHQGSSYFTVHKDQTLPLLPFSAVGGWNGVDIDGVNIDDCERMFVPYLVDIGAQFLVHIIGKSMTPTYSNGDILACRRVNDARNIQWGKVYFIDSCEGPMIKRIQQSADDECILCVSDNPEYGPFELRKEEIRSISLVVGSIQAE